MGRLSAGIFILLIYISANGQEKKGQNSKQEKSSSEIAAEEKKAAPKPEETDSSDTTDSTKKEKEPESEKPALEKKEKASPSVENEKSGYTSVPGTFETELPGGILFGKFDSSSSPFLITGSIIVPSGQKLEFGPGCRVYLGGEYPTVTVFGQLIARGTSEKPVLFRSANRNPKPWDWDRIYCRSRNRSVFEHCIIQHCNYGLFVENGSATVDHCLFEQNSLHGMVVKNSDVSLLDSRFHNGHVLALFFQEGARVRAESLHVVNNITGIACGKKSSLNLIGGEITNNTNGVAVKEDASVTIIGAEITRNRKGLVSLVEIPKKVREMVFANVINFEVVSKDEMARMLKPPEEVESIVLPKTTEKVDVGEGFKSGFSATHAPRQQTVSFMGNVTAGFKYYSPESKSHSILQKEYDTTYAGTDSQKVSVRYSSKDTLVMQSRYPGEQNDEFYAGFQPEMQIFASGRRKGADLNLLMDVYGNQWIDLPLHMKKNTFNLNINYYNQHLVMGDFFESNSKTSLESRKFTGIRYSADLLPMGKGANRINFRFAGGETEFPKDVGDNDITLYNDTVDTGMSIRQQMTYLAGFTVKPTLNSKINVNSIISRDQGYEPLFRRVISDPEVPDPIEAQTGAIDGSVLLFDDKLTLTAELDVGVHDTLTPSQSEEIQEIAWYKPQIGEAVSTVFKEILDRHLEHWAMSLGAAGLVNGFDLAGSFTRIGPEYFSAGNPYLEADRYIGELKGEKTIIENLTAAAGYEYEMRYATNKFNLAAEESGPTHVNTIDLDGEYTFSPKWPSVGIEYQLMIENTDEPGEKYIVDYSTILDSTISDDGLSKTYDYALDTLEQKYRELDMKNLWGIQLKQRFDNGISYSLRYRTMWDNDMTDYPNPELAVEDDGWQHQINTRFGFKIKRLIRNTTTFKITTKSENQYTFEGLSYKIGNKLKVTAIPRKLSFELKGDYYNRTDDEDEYTELGDDAYDILRTNTVTKSYGIETAAKYSLSSMLSLTLMGRYEKSSDEVEGSTENYEVIIGGLHVTYLF
ncbi:MAG: hypothetical protein GF401_13655 [Chitinivibrionales bacterium]|nr:hypothetical protein [Chitinivibrionales bacterium]